jgi:hypothetical protein
MGRFYNGMISGKFWFGIQDSQDADHFGGYAKPISYSHVCTCLKEDESEEFCQNCFSSRQEHLDAMASSEISDTSTWYRSDCEVSYLFTNSHMHLVKKGIAELEPIVGMYMDPYQIIDEDTIEYRYTLPEEIRADRIRLVARLCLGRQILYCLEKHGVCTFVADL